ncbi:MAG: MarR family winged helix-turn-helix transcriptional regulator [Pseudomonadota bacterium]
MRTEPTGRDDRATRDFVAFRVERAHARITAQAARVLAKDGALTPRQWWIITDMVAEKPTTATELAQIADLDKGLLSRNLKALREMGFVHMERDPGDQRQQIISLTDAGHRKHEELLPLMTARNQWLVHDVSDEDLETTFRVLEKLELAAETTDFAS